MMNRRSQENKTKSGKEKLLNFAILFLSLTALAGCIFTGIYMFLSQKEAAGLNRLEKEAGIFAAFYADGKRRETGGSLTVDTLKEHEEIILNLNRMHEKNADLTGWITVPDTNISYPVMYTPQDREFYLHRDYEGKYSLSGLPFLDGDSLLSPRSDNLIIYGHNMKNGRVFAGLLSFDAEDFWEEHKTVVFHTLTRMERYEVAAVLYVDASKRQETQYGYRISFSGAEDFEQYDSFLEKRELYDTGVPIAYGDRLLTLSTCSYQTRDGRFLVVCKKLPS